MEKVVRILILEDNPIDFELVQFEMQEAGLVFTSKVVMTENDFVRELQEFSPDLILSDYDLPHYNGALALAEARRRCPDTPFILVTGAVTEDRAIDILTQGAKDYVLKNRLQQRLVPAVLRALAEATEHRARQQAELELREAHRQLQTMLNLYHRADTHIQDIEAFVIEECMRISESILGFFGFINEDETVMMAHLWSKQAMEGCSIDFKPVEFAIDHAGIWAESIRKHEILIVNDYPKPDPRKKGYPKGHVQIESLMSIPIIKGGKAVAIMAVANKKLDYNETDILHLSLFLESVWDILKRMEAEEKLKERNKELNCLYSISEVARRNDIAHETILKECVCLLAQAFKFTDITACRIIWNNHVYSTDNFRETAWLQSRPIIVHDKKVGCVEVCYLEERPEEYEGPFLAEECNLLHNIADILGKSTERRQSKEERDRLILELRDANCKIKTLGSLIPIEPPEKNP